MVLSPHEKGVWQNQTPHGFGGFTHPQSWLPPVTTSTFFQLCTDEVLQHDRLELTIYSYQNLMMKCTAIVMTTPIKITAIMIDPYTTKFWNRCKSICKPF